MTGSAAALCLNSVCKLVPMCGQSTVSCQRTRTSATPTLRQWSSTIRRRAENVVSRCETHHFALSLPSNARLLKTTLPI
jgi:hypothetical protein